MAALMESFLLSPNGFSNGNSAPNSATQVSRQQVPSQAAFSRPNAANEDVSHPQTLNMPRIRHPPTVRLIARLLWTAQARVVSKVTDSYRRARTLSSHRTMEGVGEEYKLQVSHKQPVMSLRGLER